MTELMIQLRRSPRMLLERDGHPGPEAGHLALVLSRAGVGKTALLVGIGIDALLSGRKVLHVSLERTVDKVREWYDDILMEMLKRERRLEVFSALQLDTERRRHIHTYMHDSFTAERLGDAVDLIGDTMDFSPDVIIVDRLELEEVEVATVQALKDLAARVDAELWMACRIHRDGPKGEEGQLPPPADRFADQVDLAFRLDPHDDRVRLHVLKDRQQMLDKDLHILLDPTTLLLETGVKR